MTRFFETARTAPGDGIQIRGWGLLFQGGVHDIVIRHLRRITHR
jgi:hypothetical protein